MPKQSNPYHYIIWVITLSIPFYLIGELGFDFLPVGLPTSAFMAICPALAVMIFTSKKKLWEITFCSFQLKSLNLMGCILAILIMPCVLILKFYIMNYSGAALPIPQISMVDIGVLTFLFFASSITEEIGWTGYLTNELLKKHSILITGSIVGLIWAIWHVIPYFQMGKESDWIIWQCVASVLKRIVMVWMFVKFIRSVFITILFHAAINLSVFVFPIMGSHYDPFYFSAIFLGLMAVSYSLIKSFYFVQKVKKGLIPPQIKYD